MALDFLSSFMTLSGSWVIPCFRNAHLIGHFPAYLDPRHELACPRGVIQFQC